MKKMPVEIVVADTGSTDSTREVMQKYADITGEFQWCDNFAMAKNYVASLATNDWIFTVDSDEYITKFDCKEIENFIKRSGEVLGSVYRENTFTTDEEDRISGIWIPRIYNRKIYQYEGRIHEQLRRIDGRDDEYMTVQNLTVTMLHDGYAGTSEDRKKKAMRNKQLLLLDLEELGEKPYTLYQLGKSCYMAGEYKEATEYFSRGLEFDLNPTTEYVIDMVETYGYALINSGQAEVALGLESVYEEFGASADFVFLMGSVYMNNGMLDEAVEQFLKAAQMPEGRVTGVNSYLAYFNVGVIYECAGYVKEAKNYYKKCGNYEKAKERLRKL